MAEKDPSSGEDAGDIGSPQATQDALKGAGEGRTSPLETVLGGQSKTGVGGVDGEGGGGGDDATMAGQDPSYGAEDAAGCGGCGINGIQDVETVSGTQAGPSDVARSSSSPPAPESPGSYEEYECRICYHLYDLDGRTPRMLECLHTFCLQCLRRLHPTLEEADFIRCPLCRHPTALPDGSALSLPLNTKRIQAILLQLHGWAPLLQPHRPPPAPTGQPKPLRRRSPTAPASPSSPDWRRKAGWVCALFSGLALLLLGLAWMEWLTGSVFLGVALALLFFSTMPFVMYRIRFRSQPGTVFLPSIAASGGSREASPGRLTPRSRPRPALDGRTLSS